MSVLSVSRPFSGYRVFRAGSTWTDPATLIEYEIHCANTAHSMAMDVDGNIRFEVRSGDRRSNDIEQGNQRERAELKSNTNFQNLSTVSLEASFRGLSLPPTAGDVTQLLTALGPILQFSVNANELVIRKWTTPDGDPSIELARVPIVFSDLNTIAATVTLDDTAMGGTGNVVASLNGAQIVNSAGPIGYGISAYAKHGLYRSAQLTPTVMMLYGRRSYQVS